MTIKIAPSILSCDPAEFRLKVQEMIAGGCDWIHFDVMDGQFVPPITFGADLVASLRRDSEIPFDAHLMTETPERHFEAFIAAGAKRIAFHYEATPHAHRLAQSLRAQDIEAGIAINPGTPACVLEPLLGVADDILVMTVNPGWGGQRLIPECVDKVREIRRMAPSVEITVDGGVDPDTIWELAEAGATRFVTGSYLMKAPSIAAGIARLREVCA